MVLRNYNRLIILHIIINPSINHEKIHSATLTLMFLFSIQVVAQNREEKNGINISVPAVWNKTEIFNSYSGAKAKNISGSAMSYGINLSYSRTIGHNLFAVIGLGFYIQNFGIECPFDMTILTLTCCTGRKIIITSVYSILAG